MPTKGRDRWLRGRVTPPWGGLPPATVALERSNAPGAMRTSRRPSLPRRSRDLSPALPCKNVGVRDCVIALDRKSTRLNSSHQIISYAVFCLKKKKKYTETRMREL